MIRTHYIIHLRASLFWIFFFFFTWKYLCPTYHKVEGGERGEDCLQKNSQILGPGGLAQGPEQVLLLSGKEGSWTRWSSEGLWTWRNNIFLLQLVFTPWAPFGGYTWTVTTSKYGENSLEYTFFLKNEWKSSTNMLSHILIFLDFDLGPKTFLTIWFWLY